MGRLNVLWQTLLIDRKTVILAGNQDLACDEILNRVISAVMPEFHLRCLGAGGKGQ